MNPAALSKCKSRLRIAERALTDLEAATEPDDFGDAWTVFLQAWKGVYTLLEQGAKESAQSRQWFGRKKAQRKADHLLNYLFHARNDEEHGLCDGVTPTAGEFLFKIKGGEPLDVHFKKDPVTGEIQFDRTELGEATLVTSSGIGFSLVAVEERDKRLVHPPIAHNDEVLSDMTPLGVGRVGLRAIKAIVAEAEKL